MKIEINVDYKFLFVTAGILLVAWVFVFVGAYNPSGSGGVPSTFGHSIDEVDWSQPIWNDVTIRRAGEAKLVLNNPNGKNWNLLSNDAGEFVVKDSTNQVLKVSHDGTNGRVEVNGKLRLLSGFVYRRTCYVVGPISQQGRAECSVNCESDDKVVGGGPSSPFYGGLEFSGPSSGSEGWSCELILQGAHPCVAICLDIS